MFKTSKAKYKELLEKLLGAYGNVKNGGKQGQGGHDTRQKQLLYYLTKNMEIKMNVVNILLRIG